MRRTYDTLVLACIFVCAALGLLLVALTPAQAQFRELTPADMRIDTPCSKSGAGRNPRTQAIVEAQIPAQRVGPSGYWMLCEEHADHGRQVADITRGTACGAPAVGIHAITGVIYATANPHEFVTADGVWQRCDAAYVPVKPASAKDVRCELPSTLRWSANTEPGTYVPSEVATCSVSASGALKPGQSRSLTNMGIGTYQGTLLLACGSDGKLSVTLATCDQAQACVASAYRASDDGGATWWTFQGRLLEGATGPAAGPDGKTRPVQCVAGRLRLM